MVLRLSKGTSIIIDSLGIHKIPSARDISSGGFMDAIIFSGKKIENTSALKWRDANGTFDCCVKQRPESEISHGTYM